MLYKNASHTATGRGRRPESGKKLDLNLKMTTKVQNKSGRGAACPCVTVEWIHWLC